MIGTPPQHPEEYIEKIILQDPYGPVCFYLLPFVKPSMVKNVVGTREDGSGLSYNEALHRLISREKSWMKIERRLGEKKVIVAVNWSDKPAKLPLVGRPVLSTHNTKKLDCELKPWEAVLLEEPPRSVSND